MKFRINLDHYLDKI
jgi:hypothetical protein